MKKKEYKAATVLHEYKSKHNTTVTNLDQLGGQDDDRCGAVANLLVLQVRELDENLGPRRCEASAEGQSEIRVSPRKLFTNAHLQQSHRQHNCTLRGKLWCTNPAGRVLDIELSENRGAVVGDDHLAGVVDEHLIEADRTERRLDNVGHCGYGQHCAWRSEVGN